MRTKKLVITVVVVVCVVALFLFKKTNHAGNNGEVVNTIKPVKGPIQSFISTTGTVLPKNRLEIKPPVNGRVENILVKEGEIVKTGQIIAWMSSTERAALLDAARGQGEDKLKYWEETYKAIPLISPIDGEVIVAKTQPGQTVAASDPIIILSDQLIVRSQVDETDIGKVKLGQKAIVMIDSYPDTKINSVVEHLYYESKTVNNVTIYEVDLIPEEIPPFFRSGMNATIDFEIEKSEDAILVPSDAVFKEKDSNYVLVETKDVKNPEKREVKLGISDGKNTEIISGLGVDDTIVVKTKKYSLPSTDMGSNPFMPQRKKTEGKKPS